MKTKIKYFIYIALSYSLYFLIWTRHTLQPTLAWDNSERPADRQLEDGSVQDAAQINQHVEYPDRQAKWFKETREKKENLKNGSTMPNAVEYYSKRDKKVNHYKYDYVINENSLCDNKTEMLIIIHSYHPYTDRRTAIRKTWGSFARNQSWPKSTANANVKLIFIFGMHDNETFNINVLVESEHYHDVIQGDFREDYTNLTLKSLLGLKYCSEYCPSAKYLLKSDDDMFVNLPYLLEVLRKTQMHRSIMGPLNNNALVMRAGKWNVPFKLFPFDRYPPYHSGAAYVISGDITRELFDTAEYVPAFSVDDAYITGVLGKIIKVKHWGQSGFTYKYTKLPSPCTLLRNKVISGTGMTPLLLQSTWAAMHQLQLDCKEPIGKH